MGWSLRFTFRGKPCFLTGKLIYGLCMSRKIGETRQWRPLSVSEQAEYVSSEAW